MPLYTAQYRYSGIDRLDITVKGQDGGGKCFAPTWAMVNGVKNGTMTEADYEQQYIHLINTRWNNNEMNIRNVMTNILTILNYRDITFVCFCRANTFCHRYILVKWIQSTWTVHYAGEKFRI